MKSFLVQNSVVKRLYERSSCYPQNLNAQVEMKMQNLGKVDQLVWQASCTARLTLWKKRYLSLTFIGIRGSKKSHFFSLKKGTTSHNLFLDVCQLLAAPSANELCTWCI